MINMDYSTFLEPLEKHPGFFKPNYTRCITQVLPTVLDHMDISHECSVFKSDLVNHLNYDYDIAINLMIDSLGLQQLFALQKKISKGIEFLNLYEQLNGFSASSVFPTITSTAIPSYHTGLKPIEHGILGHRIYLPEIGSPIDTLKIQSLNSKHSEYRRDPLYKAGINPQAWLFNQNDLFKSVERQAVRHFEISHFGIHNSGLSHFYKTYSDQLEYFMGRGSVIQAFSLAMQIIKKLNQYGEKGIINVYFGELDTTSHMYGPHSNQYLMELQQLISAFGWFIKQIRSFNRLKTIISITGDHGQAKLKSGDEFILQCNLNELKFIKRMYKTGRVVHCHVTDSVAALEELRSFVKPEMGVVLDFDETLALLGGKKSTAEHIKNKVRQRIGELQIIFKTHYHGRIFENTPENGSNRYTERFLEFEMKGSHGSLTPAELVVPVLLADVNDIYQYYEANE